MQNVTITVQNNELVIRCKLDAPTTASASGKTDVLATTRGNAAIEVPGGRKVFVGLNVYFKKA